MKYETYTQKELIARIEELEILNRELLKEKEAEVGLDYPWTGNLGHWYWNIKTNTVTFNLLKATALGYTESEIPSPVTYQFFTDKLHPEDYQKTMDAMLAHLHGNAPVYEVEYRIQAKDGTYKWYYDRGKITQTDELGKPVFLAGIDKKSLFRRHGHPPAGTGLNERFRGGNVAESGRWRQVRLQTRIERIQGAGKTAEMQ